MPYESEKSRFNLVIVNKVILNYIVLSLVVLSAYLIVSKAMEHSLRLGRRRLALVLNLSRVVCRPKRGEDNE